MWKHRSYPISEYETEYGLSFDIALLYTLVTLWNRWMKRPSGVLPVSHSTIQIIPHALFMEFLYTFTLPYCADATHIRTSGCNIQQEPSREIE